MRDSKHSFFDYVKAAFGWRYRVPLLGHMPLNLFALSGFAILGFGHPAFWLLGLAYEVGYLLFLAGSQRFQNVVDGAELLAARAALEKKQHSLLQGLDPSSRERYLRLSEQCATVVGNASSGAMAAGDLRTQGLNQLLATFLQLLSSRLRLKSTLTQVTEKDLKEEIARIGQKIAREAPDTPLNRSLQGTLDIANKRLDNLQKATESLKVMEAELERIEKQLSLLIEETSVTNDPTMLTVKLDGVMQSLQDTSRWLQENREFLSSMDEPVTDNIAVMPGRGQLKQ